MMPDPRPEPGLLALVTHARHVPSERREAFADAAGRVVGDARAILVRTCHRAELYLAPDPGPAAPPLPLPALPDGGRRLEGMAAARHLFTVAAGLDSVVVGEDQILHQLRDCLSDRRGLGGERCADEGLPTGPTGVGGLDPRLERLFQVALHVGRESRAWREGPPRSLADVALDRAAVATGPLDGRRVLVVGAGRMARLVALTAGRRGCRVLVANRSADRGAALAYDAGGEAAAFGLEAPLPAAEAIVLAISARWPLGAAARADLLAGAAPVVDLSSPPALDAATREALGTRYTSVDDLARSPQDEPRRRLRARFERLLDDAQGEYAQWWRARAAVPAIQALSDRAETRRAEELERLFRRVDLADHERELVEQMSHRLVAGILHAPLVTLREDASEDLEQAVRLLFAL